MKLTTHYITNVEVDDPTELKFCCNTLQTLVVNNRNVFFFEVDRQTGQAKMYQMFGNQSDSYILLSRPPNFSKMPYNFCQFCGEKIE